MNDRLAKAETVFHEALELPPEQREGFLQQACGEDAELGREVAALLRASGVADRWLKEPANSRIGAAVDPSIGSSPPDGIPEGAGTVIGRYKLREKVGEGGCGVVYVAEQEEPVRRRVALKVIKLGMDSKSVVARFEAERQALAMMDHPNIAKVLDAGAADTGRPYFVMELVRGIRITDYCDQNSLSTGERLDLFIKVCQAVQHAHQKGIIHRDLKPSNILVTLHDGVPVPKVIDFGIAKATEGRLTEATVYTQLHQFIGTPAYISPEQAEMSGLDIDTRADIYSLGVLLYELLTGQTPFSSEELLRAGFDTMRRTIREKEPVSPSTRLSTMLAGELTATAKRHGADPPELIHLVRGDLDWIVMKCLEKDRTRRYETANGLATDLKRHLSNETVVARPPSAAYRFHKLVRRNKLAFAATGAVAAILVVATLASTWQAIRATRERNEKEKARQEAEAVSTFLTEVFQSPDPERDGRTISVAETLDAAARNLDTLAHQPSRRVKLQTTLGKTYHALGLDRDAIPLLEKARDYYLATLGPEHPDSLSAMDSLANSYHDVGRQMEALKLREELLALRRKVCGPEHLDTLSTMHSLAQSYFTHLDAGRDKEALKLCEEALALCRKVLGPQHPETLRAMHNLASSYYYLGRREEALKLKEEVLALRRKVLRPEHPETLRTMRNLAESYSDAGRREEAFKLREELLALRRKVNGPEHPETLRAMGQLTISYFNAGRREEALKLREEVLALRRKVLSPEHRDTLGAMNHLAISYYDAGRREEALKLREEVLAFSRTVNGPEHPDTLSAMQNLAELRYRQGHYAAAEALYRERIEGRLHRAGGETSDTVLGGRASLGRLYSDWAWAERATASAAAHERAIEGEKLIRETLAVREGDAKYPAWRKAELQSRLGGTLSVLAFTDPGLTAATREPKLVEAEAALQRGQTGMEQDKNTETKHLRDGIERFIRLYEAWDKPEKLSEWQQKLAAFKAGKSKSSQPAQEDSP